jgi:hypothetical protein
MAVSASIKFGLFDFGTKPLHKYGWSVLLHFVPSALNPKGNLHNCGIVSYLRGKLELELQFFYLRCWALLSQ